MSTVFFWAGSGIQSVPYFKEISYFSMSQRATVTGLARESKVCPTSKWSWVQENKPAHLLLLYDDCLMAQHP